MAFPGSHWMLACFLLFAHLTGETTVRAGIYGGDGINTLRRDLGHSTTISSVGGQPRFDPLLPRNVTVLAGKSAYLTCRVHNLANKTVSWIRHRDLHILTVADYTYTSDERFQTSHQKESEEWTLHIKRVQQNDSGMYECQVSSQPITSYAVYLNAIDSSDFNYKRTVKQVLSMGHAPPMHEIYQTMYSDQVPTAAILGGPDLYTNIGSSINLTCTIRFASQPPYIYWLHGDKVVQDFGRVSVNLKMGQVSTSVVLIRDVVPADSGKYSCMSENVEETSVNVHVSNQREMTAAIQQNSANLIDGNVYIIYIFMLSIVYLQSNQR